MSAPCCKILIYNTDDDLTHTITDDIIECYTNDQCTTGVGSFKFTLPANKAFTNVYDDIGDFYKVKIYYGYNATYTHLFSGRIINHSTALHGTATRTFQGKGLSEILERYIKRNTFWKAVGASNIVGELADDLLLAKDIEADATEETITVMSEIYHDLLKRVSDYWVDASTQVQKDFTVNKDGTLVWKARPWRTVGVETLTNILEYDLIADISNSKNYFKIYGANSSFLPLIPDDLTESTAGWTATLGTLSASADHQVGSYAISVAQATSGALLMYRTLPESVTAQDTNHLFFHYKATSLNPVYVRLYAPDSDNVFHASLTADGSWRTFDKSIGSKYMASGFNSDGVWGESRGRPNWMNITAIEFDTASNVVPCSVLVDGIYFNPVRPNAEAEDTINQASYGFRETEIQSDSLLTVADCQSHGETLLYQQKDRIMRLDPVLPGNVNILVGDRLSVTLPLDNIVATDFDVVSVENHYAKAPIGYQTVPHLVNTSKTRTLPPKNPLESLQQTAIRSRAIVNSLYTRLVR